MDLIYTDKNREDVGVIHDFSLDLAFGSDENDFELALDINSHCCEADGLVYIEGTEYGGIIDRLNIATSQDKLVYSGRTWQGIIASKRIKPDEGQSYLYVSGEANHVLGTMIDRLGLSDLFVASEEDSGLTINNYRFERYTDAYVGLTKMLESVLGKLKFQFTTNKVVISALPIVDYSQDEQFDNDQVEMEIQKTYNNVNHLICLGKGELKDRQVVHLYRNAKGQLVSQQVLFGLEEIEDVYDYPNAESLDELKTSGTEKFMEYVSNDKVQMDFASEDTVYDIGDIVGAKEIKTGIFASEKITKKIVTVNRDSVNIQYKVGE